MTASRSPSPKPSPTSGERLQKVLAAAGFGSRRTCEELITTGRVSIDGQVVESLGTRVDVDTQRVAVDGDRVKLQAKKYYLINKPTGYLCTNDDPAGRPRVIDLFPAMETRLFTVGRLDENTEGLLLVTNDGELAHRLAHPKFQVERIYRVLVAGHPTPEILSQLQEGMYFSEGKFRLRQARKLKTKGQSTLLEVVITEGQNREVRRLFARLGHKVMALQRVQFGPLRLGELEPAEYRPLRPQELDKLHELASSQPAPRRAIRKRPAKAARPFRPEAPLLERGRPPRPEGPPKRPAAMGKFKRVLRRPEGAPSEETGERRPGPRPGLGKRPGPGKRPLKRVGPPRDAGRPRPEGQGARMKKGVRKRPPRPREGQ